MTVCRNQSSVCFLFLDAARFQSSKASSRRRSLGNVGGVSQRQPTQNSIIARMLASPDSLLTMCLTKGNFPQASQVIKVPNAFVSHHFESWREGRWGEAMLGCAVRGGVGSQVIKVYNTVVRLYLEGRRVGLGNA
jgi:hypothetical protein